MCCTLIQVKFEGLGFVRRGKDKKVWIEHDYYFKSDSAKLTLGQCHFVLILFLLINMGVRQWVVRVGSRNLLTSNLEVILTMVNCSKLFTIVAKTFHLICYCVC